jgi:AcrR family transcriptional regulator
LLRDGYAATTVAQIAADAGVAPKTVAKQFGNKPGLVKALFDVALVGDDDGGALEERDPIIAIHDEPDPRRKLQLYGHALAAMLPRTAPIQMLMRDSGDPVLASVWAGIKAGRLAGMTNLANNLAAGGHLRPGVTAEDARDVLWTYSSPELYQLLVVERGWTSDRYADLVATGTAASLLPD